MREQKRILTSAAVILALVAFMPIHAYAEVVSSPNYTVDQTFFGAGGELDSSSSSYRARSSVGELGVGAYESDSYFAQAGFNTTDLPFIEFIVTADNIDLGVLTASSTETANGVFQVRAWQSGGYAVTTTADPPRNSSYTMATPATPTASAQGTEQFGMNLVANTSPTTFGAVPQQVPDDTFSFGAAAAGYDTANLYKYVKGDTIASSAQSTSVTIYTLSYIFNISALTAGGTYTFNHIIVATGTY